MQDNIVVGDIAQQGIQLTLPRLYTYTPLLSSNFLFLSLCLRIQKKIFKTRQLPIGAAIMRRFRVLQLFLIFLLRLSEIDSMKLRHKIKGTKNSNYFLLLRKKSLQPGLLMRANQAFLRCFLLLRISPKKSRLISSRLALILQIRLSRRGGSTALGRITLRQRRVLRDLSTHRASRALTI